MDNYPLYSNDIWDYLRDMAYMPTRKDRDMLSKRGDEKRVQIWDFFFRIRSEDVGKPQKLEIERLLEKRNTQIASYADKKIELEAKINRLSDALESIKDTYLKQVDNQKSKIESIKEKQKNAARKRRRVGVIGVIVGIVISVAAIAIAEGYVEDVIPVFFCTGPLTLYGFIAIMNAKGAGKKYKPEIQRLELELEKSESEHEINVKNAEAPIASKKNELEKLSSQHKIALQEIANRISILEENIEELIKQIPSPPSHSKVRRWLKADLQDLDEYSIESTGLETRLVNLRLEKEDGSIIEAPNPLRIVGPGELQDPDRIPPSYTGKYPDRVKHLRARHLVTSEDGGLEVLYGVYYLECVLVADDMLATCGFFYDFITGKQTAEQTTEQYYQDVVAIATTKEFRTITLGEDDEDTWEIEDAPTFGLSLKGGERRSVTFANSDYFNGLIGQLEDLTEEKVKDISAISEAQQVASNAISALRSYLRKHKGLVSS